MTAPAVAAGRFAIALAMGAMLGLLLGFLRPLRPRWNHLCDLVFLAAAFHAWLYLGFAVCRGDLRIGYFSGLAAGALAWEMTIGKVLRPAFLGFWKIFAMPFQKFSDFFQKIFKKLFAFRKKTVTIEWNNRSQNTRKAGGMPHGKKTRKIGISQQSPDGGHRLGGRYFRHRGSGDAARLSGSQSAAL